MSHCSCKTSTREMTYTEFTAWAHEYIMEKFLTDGLKGMRLGIEMVIQQQNMNHAHNKGGFPEPKGKK